MNDDGASLSGSRLPDFVEAIAQGVPEDRRESVREELLGHLVASVESQRFQGIGPAEAETQAMARLGSPGRLRCRLVVGLFLRDLGEVRVPSLLAFLGSMGFLLVQGRAQQFLNSGWPPWALVLASTGIAAIAMSFPIIVTLASLTATGRLRSGTAFALGLPAMGCSFLPFIAATLCGLIVDAAARDSYWVGAMTGPTLFGLSHYAFALITLMRAARWGGRRPLRTEAVLLPLPAALAFPAVGVVWGICQPLISEAAWFALVRWGTLLAGALNAATLVLVAIRVAPMTPSRVEAARA